jgi:hypothetical protein
MTDDNPKGAAVLRSSRLACRAVTLALAGLLAAAPSALAGGAETITAVERQIDVNPGETNPCTGATGTILDDEQDVFHLTSLANGTLQLTGHGTTTVTFAPDDPRGVRYDGHETFNFSATGGLQGFATTTTNHLRVRGSDGSFVTFRQIARVTVTSSGVVTDFDRPTLLCS